MQVVMLADVSYVLRGDESPRLWGKLRTRTTRLDDGRDGPMEHYFPQRSKPELPDDLGRLLIERGQALEIDGPRVEFVDAATALADVARAD